ncbi:MAG TPA: alpha/beta hydrolase [Acidimicrobiales bacterium]|jgi:acetyl esterase/lipase
MTEDFHPELRRVARFLPRAVLSERLLPLHRAAGTLIGKVASKKAPVFAAGSVSVRLHRPATAPAGRLPGLLWIHGGGYVAGTAAGDDFMCKLFAESLGIVVAAVDYRLAPDYHFPVPLEDCYDGLRWLARHESVDPTRLAIGGASAGGGLAAALALLARERAEVALRLQLLAYPMLDDRTALRTDIDETNIRGWTNKSNAFGWRAYTGFAPGSDEVSQLAAPGRCQDFAGLPPCWLGVGTLDLFYDESVVYAKGLQGAGVPCQLDVVPGAFHGFDMISRKAEVSKAFRASQLKALADALC